MAGDSAQREFERLRDERRAFIRNRFWVILALTAVLAAVLGGLAHAYLGLWWLGAVFAVILVAGKLAPTQREAAFARGAEGERIVGAAMDRLAGGSSVVLHDRLIPGSRANIDHILVGISGVWTVDAKRYKGRIEARARGRELWVNGRNRSKLLDQSDRQVTVVRDVLARAGCGDIPVRGALCFTGVEWPWLFPPREIRGVRITSPKGLSALVGGPTAVTDPQRIAGILESALEAAVQEDAETVASPDAELPAPSPEPARYEHFATPVETRSAPTPPVCSCGEVMVERKRRKDGQRFWGCSTFPSCRRTMPWSTGGGADIAG
jgi:hypothetical protein